MSMYHYQINYSILEHAIVGICVFLCVYLFSRITLGIGVKTMLFNIIHMCSLLKTLFYGIYMVPITPLTAMRIGFRDAR